MKKFLSLIITALILCVVTCAFAASVDFSALTDDELLQAQTELQLEMMDRHIAKTAKLKAGNYLVGKDIPAGTYYLYGKYEGDSWRSCYLYKDSTRENQIDYWNFWGSEDSHGENGECTYRIILEEGNLLNCDLAVEITIAMGVVFE